MDPRLADAMLAAGIITAEQADALREELRRRSDALWGVERDASGKVIKTGL